MLRVYTYAKCSTCRAATKWLKEHGVAFEERPIRETPPSIAELRVALKAADGNVRRLFNTSGMDFRALGMKEKLATMSAAEALGVLAGNGNLIKRPFALDEDRGLALTGFEESRWVVLAAG